MKKNFHLIGSLPTFGALAGLLFAVSCSQKCPECPPTPLPAKKLLTVEYPSVCLKELSCVKLDFRKHFVPATSKDSTKLMGRMQWIKWATLNELIANSDRKKTGAKFHYGASGSGDTVDLKLALELVQITERVDPFYYNVTVATDSKVYPINSNGGFDTSLSLTEWTTTRGRDYFNLLEVYRTNDVIAAQKADALLLGSDHDSFVFRLDDIDDLIGQNAGSNRLHIYAIASPKVRKNNAIEDDWMHDIALVAAKDGTEKLDDDARDQAVPLLNKALDLGSPCPPSCVLAHFYRYGLAPRDICTCK